MKIGILSDTHGLLRPEVLTALEGCDVIFHGGDINKQQILDELEQIAPVYVVRGNNDKEWAENLPETLDVEYGGLKIFMVHNKKFLPKDLSEYDLVIFGHSHKYEERWEKNTLILNPGSCGPRRFHQEITLAVLGVELDGNSGANETRSQITEIRKIIIPHAEPSAKQAGKLDTVGKPESSGKPEAFGETAEDDIPADLALRLPAIMQDINKGKTVKQIAKKYKLTEELSEEIARMYLTHPGVDVDGILRRLGL